MAADTDHGESPEDDSGPPLTPENGQHHVIVCGLRGVGLRTVEQLVLSNVPVVVVDDDPDLRLAKVVQGWGVRAIHRSARIGDGLVEAGLGQARAVVCAAADELATLEIALRVRELRPDVRLVVEMVNPSVAKALERVTGAGSVLNVATLAAPSMVEACLGRRSHSLDVEGVVFSVVEVKIPSEPDRKSTFRNRFASLAPVAIVNGESGHLFVCPGRDHEVGPGDRVTVLGTELELTELGIDPQGKSSVVLAPEMGLVVRIRRRIAALNQNSSTKGLMLVGLGIFALIVVSSLVLRLAYQGPDGHHLGILQSVYFTVETVATVGFGDYSFAAQGPWLEVFAIVLIIVGVTMVSTAFALFTNMLVGLRIEQSLGRGRVPGMSDHVVVVGLGAVGIAVVEGLLAEGRQVVVVERDADNRYLGRARALRVPVVIADATQRQTHIMVNLDQASAVAVMTSRDLTNIETALAIRDTLGERFDDVPVVVRVFDGELARMMEDSLNFHYVRSTSALAAPWFAGAALGIDLIETFYVDRQPFLVGAVSVTPHGGLHGTAMLDLSAQTRVIAINRASGDGLEHPPRRGTRFSGGDRAYMLGPYEELLRVLRLDETGPDHGDGVAIGDDPALHSPA